jgi:hypothetical protein
MEELIWWEVRIPRVEDRIHRKQARREQFFLPAVFAEGSVDFRGAITDIMRNKNR